MSSPYSSTSIYSQLQCSRVLYCTSQVVPAYVAQADEAAIERLRTVEDVIIGWSLRKRSPDDKVRFGKWQRMAASEPSLVAGVISPKHRARPQSVEQVCLREGEGVEELWIACYIIRSLHILTHDVPACY